MRSSHGFIGFILALALAVGTTVALADSGPSAAHGHHRPSSRFGWPVSPHHLVRGFHPPAARWGAGHRGVDLASVPHAEIVAPSDGVVTFSGVVAGRGVLTLQHREGFSTTYEPVSDRISTGTTVRRGQRLGHLDAGHCSSGVCLHWGYRVAKDEYLNPLVLIGIQRPVLLPPLPESSVPGTGASPA